MIQTENIKLIVERITGVSDISKVTRIKSHILARAVYVKILRDLTDMSLVKIGQTINKDHASVIHSLKNFDVYYKSKGFVKNYQEAKSLSLKYLEVDSDVDVEKEIQLEDLKEQFKILKNSKKRLELKYQNSFVKSDLASEIIELIEELNENQIATFKERLKAYVSICEDQNKRNSFFINKKNSLHV